MQFRVDADNYFGWVSAAPTPSIEDVTCVVDGVACGVAQSTDRPEVFVFGPIKSALEAYDVPYTISVDGDTADYGLIAFAPTVASQSVATALTPVVVVSEPAQDLTFTLLDKTGSECLADVVELTESESNPGSYSGHVTAPELAGFYIGVVLAGDVPIGTTLLVVDAGGRQSCLFVAARIDGGSSTAIDEAEVLISYNNADCRPVVKLVTDSFGAASTSLGIGEYIATLRKPPLVFSQNNFEFSITAISSLYRTVHLTTKWFSPTFTPTVSGSTVVLSGYLRGPDGRNLPNESVLAEPLTNLFAADSPVGHAKSMVVARTSATGYFELRLVPGISVRIGIPILGLTRVVTVPEDDTELFSLLSSAPDAFTIVNLRPAKKVAR